ncbi:MAG: GHKL domain-containing protein [Oscillospiraceae bacterium]|nr:GHKL domain-containing protein [Oscillospiraceae bacterium]
MFTPYNNTSDIFYIVEIFLTTIIEFLSIMIAIPPKKFSKILLPVFFTIKFIGNIFKGLITTDGYNVDIYVMLILSFAFYAMVYIYTSINYNEDKWRYFSFYFLVAFATTTISTIISFCYDATGVREFILSSDNYSQSVVIAEWIFRKLIDWTGFLLPLYLAGPVLFRRYHPPIAFSMIFSIVFVLIEIPGFVIMFINDFSMTGEFKYPTIFYTMLIPLMILYTILFSTVLSSNYKREKEFLKKQTQLQFDYYASLEKNQQTIRKMNHDIKNHIQALRILSENNDTEGFKKYVSEMTSSYDVKKIEYCENNIVNAAVSSKETIAKEKGITFETSINLPEKIDIDSMDIVSVFTNLLDNAIEECERIAEGEKKITLNCVCKKGTIAICCENSCLDEEKAKKLTTQKKDKLLHGLGTNIVKNIAEKYYGSYSANAENGIFSASVLMGCK